jgi:hypothetical protein
MLIIETSRHRKISTLLIEPFNIMTTFFFRRSVEKAFQLDESPSGLTLNSNKPLPGNAPYITSVVDDVMFIVNQVLQRALATSQRSVVASVIPTVGRVLGSDFIGMLQRKMRDDSYPKAAIQGAFPPENKIIQFLVLVNNLDVAIDYTKRIIATQLEAPPSETAVNGDAQAEHFKSMFPFANDSTFVVNALTGMESAFTSKCGELLSDGIEVAFHQIIKPRIRPMLADAFRDIDYVSNPNLFSSVLLADFRSSGYSGIGSARLSQDFEGIDEDASIHFDSACHKYRCRKAFLVMVMLIEASFITANHIIGPACRRSRRINDRPRSTTIHYCMESDRPPAPPHHDTQDLG